MALFFDQFPSEYQFIVNVVDAFYEKAKIDIIIGYHFRHIENFETHLPKIYTFWSLQLLPIQPLHKKNLINIHSLENIIKNHEYLKIKKGEVGRWILLFQETINTEYKKVNNENLEELKNKMIKKTELFHRIFLNSSILFK